MTERMSRNASGMSPALAPAIRLMLGILLVWQLVSLAQSSGFSLKMLRVSFLPYAGESESLPPAVGEFALLLRAQSAAKVSCSLTEAVASDSLLMQRSYEAIYPIRIDAGSNGCVLATDEAPSSSACQLNMEGAHARIYDCH